MSVAASAVLYPNVRLGRDVVIEDFCIIGCPPRGVLPGVIETVIGDGAVVRSHSVIYAGNVIGARFACGHHAFLRELNSLGDDVSLGTHSVVEHHVRISNGVRIHSRAFIPEYSELHEQCWIGPGVVLTNAKYPASPNAKTELRGVVVGMRARIGANATILPGVRLGDECLVGAGAVVTHDVPPRVVVVGNPARQTAQVLDLPCGYGGAR